MRIWVSLLHLEMAQLAWASSDAQAMVMKTLLLARVGRGAPASRNGLSF